ncbi:Legume lectin, alpha chain, conserved site [Sesbania bispinosa]|nr:Legume lectin, alpha chain, conserved site [Sesbania bispinosa]
MANHPKQSGPCSVSSTSTYMGWHHRSDSELHGDGLSFFMAPLDYESHTIQPESMLTPLSQWQLWGWKSNVEPDGALVRALIRYDSQDKELFVLVSYPGSPVSGEDSASLAHTIDLRTVLPEWVRIGFSAATGDFIEKHDILFWSFVSSFRGTVKKEKE